MAALVDNMETDDSSQRQNQSGNKSNVSIGKVSNASPTNDGIIDADQLILPPALRRRVNALRKLQLESVHIEAEFFRKVHELECEFAERMAPLNEKRQKIVKGQYEPTDEECIFSVPFDEEFLAEELQKQEAIKNDLPEWKKADYYEKGIEEFWLTAIRNADATADILQFHDEPILRYLTNVEVKTEKDPTKFTLYFHFAPNEFFTNAVLTKEYMLKCEPDPADPFMFEGPEIISSKGCKIDWKEGKNVTVKTVTKKQKHKQKGSTRIVTKQVKTDSFFNFFDPPVVPEGDQDDTMDEKLRAEFETDNEIGQFFRDTLIPRAILYYTGESRIDEDDYDDDEEEDDDDFDEEETDDDGSEDEHNQGKTKSKK